MEYIQETQFLVIGHCCESGRFENKIFNDIESLSKYLNDLLEEAIKFSNDRLNGGTPYALRLREYDLRIVEGCRVALNSTDIDLKIQFLKSDPNLSDIHCIFAVEKNNYQFK